MTYTRADLAKHLDSVETLLNFIAGLQEGDKLELRGFGTFERKRAPAAKRRNPYTGGDAEGKTFTVIRLKPSKMVRLP